MHPTDGTNRSQQAKLHRKHICHYHCFLYVDIFQRNDRLTIKYEKGIFVVFFLFVCLFVFDRSLQNSKTNAQYLWISRGCSAVCVYGARHNGHVTEYIAWAVCGAWCLQKVPEASLGSCENCSEWMRVISRWRRTPARFMGPTWGPPGSCWPQVGPM